jgi:hypothetical protein
MQKAKNEPRNLKTRGFFTENGVALWCKGYQSAPTLCVRPPGSFVTLIARAGQRSAAKSQKNAQKLKKSRKFSQST